MCIKYLRNTTDNVNRWLLIEKKGYRERGIKTQDEAGMQSVCEMKRTPMRSCDSKWALENSSLSFLTAQGKKEMQ